MVPSNLEQLKERWKLWIRCFDGDDQNSIVKQITRMVWNTAAFRVVNEGLRIAPPAKEGGVQLNGLMYRLLEDGFFDSQMLAIRRLTDGYPIVDDQRHRDVFSLTSLLEDMRKHARLMTRENMFAANGLEYDGDSIRRRYDEYVRQHIRNGGHAFAIPTDLNWWNIEERHKHADLLAGVALEQRDPQDAVRPVVMEQLKKKVLDSCKDLHLHIDKFIAHAASPGSRQAVDADSVAVTLNHLYTAHEAICKVAHFVGRYLLTGESHKTLAIPQYRYLVYIDRPLVSSEEGVETLRQAWDAYDKETAGWTLWGMEEFRQECNI